MYNYDGTMYRFFKFNVYKRVDLIPLIVNYDDARVLTNKHQAKTRHCTLNLHKLKPYLLFAVFTCFCKINHGINHEEFCETRTAKKKEETK